MKTKIVFVVLIISLFLSCTGKKLEIYGSNYGFLGIVRNNTLNIYKFMDEWIEMTDRNFTLRPGDKILYFDTGYIVIQKNNVLKLYSFNNGWTEIEGGFTLPAGYKHVFYNRIGNDIHLVKDNGIKTDNLGHRHWAEMPERNFLLPEKHGDIFLFSWLGITNLSVAENDSLNFYELDGNGLSKTIVSFTLPQGYKNIIPYFQSIGVVENGVIKFYEPSYENIEDQKWKEIPDMDFILKK